MANEPGSRSDGFGDDPGKANKHGSSASGQNNPADSHLTGSERADSTKETYRTGDTGKTESKITETSKTTGDTTRKAETYRPKAEVPKSGATATERVQPKKGFNPAWLLVPAAGLLLGGLGIANMNRKPDVKVATPSVTASVPSAEVPAQTVAPVATTSTGAAAATGCKVGFTGTMIEKPVSRLKNIQTGKWLNAPSGKQFVVVNTTVTNRGDANCWATPGYQRGYTSANTYFGGSTAAGNELYRGRRMTKSVGADKQVTGAYVFQVPTGTSLSSVRLRSNGSSDWTIVRK